MSRLRSTGMRRQTVAEKDAEREHAEKAAKLVGKLRATLPQLHECMLCTLRPDSSTSPSSSQRPGVRPPWPTVSPPLHSLRAKPSKSEGTLPAAGDSSEEKPGSSTSEPNLMCYPHVVPPRLRPRTTLMKELRNREMGNFRQLRPSLVLPSLLLSEDREYSVETEVKLNGHVDFCEHRILSPGGVVDMERRTVATFNRPPHPLAEGGETDTSRITEMLSVINDDIYADGSISPSYVICLTEKSHILIYDADSSPMELLHRFILPAHLYKFRRLDWNIQGCEFYAYGESLREHIDATPDEDYVRGAPGVRRQPVLERSCALAVFEIVPRVRVRALFKVPNKLFNNCSYCVLHEEALLVFGHSPPSLAIYDFTNIYKEFCHNVYKSGEHGDVSSSRIIDFNLSLTRPVRASAYLEGAVMSIDMAGHPLYLLIEPEKMRDNYRLLRADTLTGEPVLPAGFNLLGRHEGSQLALEMGSTFFHPDKSNRLLRFEGTSLACYTIVAPLEGRDTAEESSSKAGSRPESHLRLDWRTTLLAPPRNTATGGEVQCWRRTACPLYQQGLNPPTSRYGDFVIIRDVIHQISGVLTVLAHYQAFIASDRPINFNYLDEDEWIPIVFHLDSECGRILKILSIDTLPDSLEFISCRHEPSLHLHTDLLAFVVRGDRQPNVRRVRVLRLVDNAQRRWTSEGAGKGSGTNYRPKVLSKREARKRKREAARAAITPSSPSKSPTKAK